MNAVFFVCSEWVLCIVSFVFVRMRENLEDVASRRRKIELRHRQTQNTRETETEKNAISARASAQAQRGFFCRGTKNQKAAIFFF